MLAVVKALLYLSCVLLVGAGVFVYFITPRIQDRAGLVSEQVLKWGVGAGTLVLLAASALDIALTLYRVLGFVDGPLVYDYLGNTRHGRAVLVRGVLVGAVTLLVLTKPRVWSRGLFGASSLALLATFSWTSHAAAVGGTPPLLADLVHFAAAAAWGGSVLYLALSPAWQSEGGRALLVTPLRRVSRLGLISVLALFVTGIYTTLIHLSEPATFVTSPYGYALYVKLGLVFCIVYIAASNRFRLMPSFLKGGSAKNFSTVLRLEALILVAVFITTGVLTTSALPHGAEATFNPLTNAADLFEFLRR